jgi:hypothetical protein
VDSEVESLGNDLSDHAEFFLEELTLYIQYMDWVCDQNLSDGITKCKQVVDSLQPYIAQIDPGAFEEFSAEFIGDVDTADSWLYDDGIGDAPQARDFTEPTKERLEDLADQTNHAWNPFDAAKDDWLKFIHYMGRAASTSDVDTYDSDIVDMYNATRQEIDDIWNAVAQVDQNWTNTFASLLDVLTTSIDNFSSAANSFCKLSNYQASTYGQTMAGLGTGEDVFDKNGSFGGDQRTMPNGEKASCWDFAMINTLLEQYKNDPAGFEQKFGIPLYSGNDFNFDGIAELYYDWIKQNHPYYDKDKNLAIPEDKAGAYWEEFCKDHGVSVAVTPTVHVAANGSEYVYTDEILNVTPQNWADLAQGGTIAVTISPAKLIDPSTGGPYEVPDSSHKVDITGVTSNGYFIVSSWGKEYYLDPNAGYDSIIFSKITYN